MRYGIVKEHHKAILQSVADELIPSFDDMPSATEADVVDVWADEVLNSRHDLRQPFFKALRDLKADESMSAKEALTHLQQTDLEAFTALGTVLSGAYFLNPDIRAKLGYPGQISRAVQYEAEENPDFVQEGILDAVIGRGPIYRDVAKSAAR